jgi:putative transposase
LILIPTNYTNSAKIRQNEVIEAFNGKLRQDCLNENWVLSLEDARQKVKVWRQKYNKLRPHEALGNVSPLEYASAMIKVYDVKITL